MGVLSRRRGRWWEACVSVVVVAVALLAGPARSSVEQDREECTDQLIGLATCLPYVGGDAKAPTMECCSGVKQVVGKSMKCLCILVKDRDDPSLGLKINVTLALNLPASCHAPTNLTNCIDLLHLPWNSTQAQVFKDFAKTISTKNSSTAVAAVPASHGKASASSSGSSSDAQATTRRWLGSVEMVLIGLSGLFYHITSLI